MGAPSLKHNDFIYPYGKIQEKDFCEVTEDLEGDVKKWLTVANRKTECISHIESRRNAVEDYVYYMAYFALWQKMNTEPVEVSRDEKTTRFVSPQLTQMRRLWEEHKRCFDEAIRAATQVDYSSLEFSTVVNEGAVWDLSRSDSRALTEREKRAGL